MLYLSAMLSNTALQAAVLAWFFAQLLKGLINILIYRRFDMGRFLGMGGMPSSHSAFVCALATSTGILSGFDSTVFALAVGFAVVVMVDAAGVRRSAGLQARALNRIIRHLRAGDIPGDLEGVLPASLTEVAPRDFKELLGHTPVQVMAGSLLGVLVALVRFR